MKLSQKILFALIFFASFGYAQENQSISQKAELTITGDLAYETTSYVEKYWRIVGNAGFDSSIYFVARKLEAAGFIEENTASKTDRLTYRIEKRELEDPTWEPVDASLRLIGESDNLLEFKSNRNMIAINSHSTDTVAEIIRIEDVSGLTKERVNGKIVFAEMHPYQLYRKAFAVGAIGILSYSNPKYLQPEKNVTSIQFRGMPYIPESSKWCIPLSYEAKEKLIESFNQGAVSAEVKINTKFYESEELTIVADIKGSTYPSKRLVFSAHVQEPGANDNASGVGVALEMATTAGSLVKNRTFDPARTITFLWGDEIVSTNRYVNEDKIRARDIKWGISLDMVGQNTDITGGSFLIEKMPDPSAIWTRGKDKHTEWGAGDVKMDDLKPHYLNDFVTNRFLEQGKRANWEVNTNPFEGGSDHVPFLKAEIPGVLFWHFTDQFYHTDNDRMDKVSKETLKNVGNAALTSAILLVNANDETARSVVSEVVESGVQRLNDEAVLSQSAIENGSSITSQVEIIRAWENWYVGSIASCSDLIEDGNISETIKDAQTRILELSKSIIESLEKN